MQGEPHHPAADVVLRSSDKALFYSWKNLLSISSPVFAAMFTLPQNPGDFDACHHDGLPVIDLEEDGRTLDRILSLCHPPSLTGKQFKVNNIRELRLVLEVTMKYDMGHVRRAALEELSNPSVLREDPMGTYAIACQHECREVARLAAKHALALPSLVHACVPELEKIHAGKLWRLFLYRETCATAASSLAADHTWIVYADSSPLFQCGDDGGDEGSQWTMVRNSPSRKYPTGRLELMPVHKWWQEYMRMSECALLRWPHGDAVKDQRLVDDVLMAISTSKCKQCNASQVSATFRSFVNTFAENIERRVAEVEINLEF